MNTRILWLILPVLLPALPAGAQDHDGPGAAHVRALSENTRSVLPPRNSASAVPPLTEADLLVPIHTAKADPVGGEYGIWAAGADFKASFHGGYAFYPYLGAAYPENLPLRWKTESVTAGGKALFAEGTEPETSFTDWSFEYRYPGVTETYDVRKEGVEQTFTIHARPAAAGDLVVTGRITSRLEADPVEGAHTSLVFKDRMGKALVSYGEAFAVDALGNKTEVKTSYDGNRIRLTVPGTWLEKAAFPVTIDPLTSRVRVSSWGSSKFGMVGTVDIGRDDFASKNNVLVVYSRRFSGSDYDGYARLVNDAFGSSITVFKDVTASWSTYNMRVAFVGAPRKWVVVFQRDFPASKASGIRAHIHASGSTAPSPSVISVYYLAGYTSRNPDVGGTYSFSTSGDNALVVFQRDKTKTQANTPDTEVIGVLVNARTSKAGKAFLLASAPVGTTYDRENPSVNQVSLGGKSSWITVWQEYNNKIPKDDWDVLGQRIRYNGTRAGSGFFGNPAGSIHKHRPFVEGSGERYMVAYQVSRNLGTKHSNPLGGQVQVQRFDWKETSSSPLKKTMRVINGSSASTSGYWIGGIGYDTNSRSHWAVVYRRGNDVLAARVGYTGGIVEHVTVYNTHLTGYAPAVTFNDDANEFLVAFTVSDPKLPFNYPVYGTRFTYRATARTFLYGKGCKGFISADKPNAGSEFFRVYLGGGAKSKVAILWVSLKPYSMSLAGLGMPGCFVNVRPFAPSFLGGFTTTTNSSGIASLRLPLPDSPVFIGSLYFQWIHVYPGLNPWSLAFTRGLRADVR